MRSLKAWAVRKIRTAAATGRIHGVRGLLSAAAHCLYYRDRYVRLGLDLATWSATPAAGQPIQIIRGDGAELPVGSDGWPPGAMEFQVRYPGRRFYLVRCGGDVTHISWVVFPGDRTRFLALAPGEIEITDSHTVAPYRGRGLYQRVLATILVDMKHEGFRTAYAHVRFGNESSLRAMRAMRFRWCDVVRARRLFGVYWTSVRPVRCGGRRAAAA